MKEHKQKDATWNEETQSGTYSDKIHHGELRAGSPLDKELTGKVLSKEDQERIKADAQHRYGDKAVYQHHEQACYIAGATAEALRGQEEAIAVLRWLLQQSADQKIVLSDGEFYWEEDHDGDQPMDEKQLYDLFKQHKSQ